MTSPWQPSEADVRAMSMRMWAVAYPRRDYILSKFQETQACEKMARAVLVEQHLVVEEAYDEGLEAGKLYGVRMEKLPQ